MAPANGVTVNFKHVIAVFQIVGGARHLGGQLTGLAYRNEAGVQAVSDHGSEDESSRLDTDNPVDPASDIMISEGVDSASQPNRVLQQSRDVIEQNAGLREIRNFTNQLF